MAIWVGKQKMSCRSCIKGHRSSTCNHIGGPLWAVRPAGRPNKACIHGPGDLCLCAHYFPLTWLKAAVPRNKNCSCHGSRSSSRKCQCGSGHGTAASTPEDETQPIFYQDLVARGLQVTSEPVEFDAPPPAAGSCCSAPAPAPAQPPPPPAAHVGGSCCSRPANPVPPVQMPIAAPAPPPAPAQSSCCSGPAKIETTTPTPPVTNGYNGHVKTESVSAPFTPIRQFHSPPPDFPVMDFSQLSSGGAGHVCDCGPTCNCVLCIDHPYNNATMNHIATEFGQMMSSGAQFSPVASSGTIGPGGGSRPEFFPPGWPSNSGMMPAGLGEPSSVLSHPQSYSPPQQATDMDIILNPADFEVFNFAFPPLEGAGEPHFDASMGLGPESMADLIDINGFCGGAPEGCPCGDDCACIGCQIHKSTAEDSLALGLGNGNGTGVGSPKWNSAR